MCRGRSRYRLTLGKRPLHQVRLEGFDLATIAIIAGADLDFRRPAKGDLFGIVIPAPERHQCSVEFLGDLRVGYESINVTHRKGSVGFGALQLSLSVERK